MCGFLEVRREHLTLLDRQIIESRHGLKEIGFDIADNEISWSASSTSDTVKYNIVFSLLVILDMKK